MISAFALTVSAQAQNAGGLDYRLGEPARADILTPIELFVFDTERTEQFRQTEAQRVPPIFRFNPRRASDVEQDLRADFADARRVFLELVEARFEHRILATRELAEPAFAEVAGVFHSRRAAFPLSRSLAELWALGDTGEDAVLERWVHRLTQLERRYIRDDAFPPGDPPGTEVVRITVASEDGVAGDPTAAETSGKTVAWTNLLALSSWRRELWQNAADAERPVALYLNGFLRPNCVFDLDRTQEARAKRVEIIHAMDHYAAGPVIARRGESIDSRIQRALAETQRSTAANRGRAVPEEPKSRRGEETEVGLAARPEAAAPASAARRPTQVATKRLGFWLLFAVGSCALFAWLWLRRSLRPNASPQLYSEQTALTRERNWRRRALAAEARADKTFAVLRAGLLPHLARWMMGEMLQRMLWQRRALLASQQQAERDIAHLTERLDSIHASLEQRLNAYERRIAELETELASKDQQNQELLRARLEWTRQKLAEEQARRPTAWN